MTARLRSVLSLQAVTAQVPRLVSTVHHRACAGGSVAVLCAVLPHAEPAVFLDARDELGARGGGEEDCVLHSSLSPPHTGRTPFLVAAACGHTAILRALVTIFGADGRVSAEKTDVEGNDATMLAVRGGHAAALELLLSYGASRTQRNSERATAVHLLAEAPDGVAAARCLQLLVAKQPPTALEAFAGRDERGRNAAHLAAAARRAPLLRELVRSLGSSLLVEEDSIGESPLDVLARVAAPPPTALRAPLELPPPSGASDEPLRALLDELERSLAPAEARTHARRLARVPRADISVAVDSAAAPTPMQPAAVASSAAALAAAASEGGTVAVGVASVSEQSSGKLPPGVDFFDDEAVAEDDTYEYIADDAAAASRALPASASLGAELRRRASGSEAGSGALLLPPPPPPPPPLGHPSLLSAHQRSSSLGVDDAAASGAVVLPPDALGLSRQR